MDIGTGAGGRTLESVTDGGAARELRQVLTSSMASLDVVVAHTCETEVDLIIYTVFACSDKRGSKEDFLGPPWSPVLVAQY